MLILIVDKDEQPSRHTGLAAGQADDQRPIVTRIPLRCCKDLDGDAG